MKRTFRYLRIAFSATCGVLSLLLIMLLVRSYIWGDDIRYGILNGPGYQLISLKGKLGIWRHHSSVGATGLGWWHGTAPAAEWSSLSERGHSQLLGFSLQFFKNRPNIPDVFVVPQLLIVGLVSVSAIAPWVRWSKLRFSLRTVLIATTLIAITLGLIVWTLRLE